MDYEKTTSMRCSEELLDALDERKERGESYEDYIWTLLDQQESHARDEPVSAERAPVVERDPEPVEIDPDPAHESELIRWVRENQPAEKSEIIEHCFPDDFLGQPDSWWQRHARPELKASKAEYKNGYGWVVE